MIRVSIEVLVLHYISKNLLICDARFASRSRASACSCIRLMMPSSLCAYVLKPTFRYLPASGLDRDRSKLIMDSYGRGASDSISLLEPRS
jgi:hypothetical protein